MSPRQAYVCCALFVCSLGSACDPVLLAEDRKQHFGTETHTSVEVTPRADEPGAHIADAGPSSTGAAGAAATLADPPDVELSLTAIECGRCFDLTVSAHGGKPPYRVAWEDGSNALIRRVCVGATVVAVAVVVEDDDHVRSSVRVMQLQADADSIAACASNTLRSQLCVTNPSFEGTPAINTGRVFDAAPWSDCVGPTVDPAANTPEIASDTLDPAAGIAPVPRDGLSYLALGAGEQASQALCEVLPAQGKTSFQLDTMQLGIGDPDMFLQVWGGTSATCTQDQLLWVSPRLKTSWETYCVTLAPHAPMDQITFRAVTPTMQALATSYLAVDQLVPVFECP